MTRIWMGQRESDILTMPGYFDKSVTFYGSNGPDNYAYCSEYRRNAEYEDDYYFFILDRIDEMIAKDPDCEVHFYSGAQAYRMMDLKPGYEQYFKYVNDFMLIDWLNNKTYTRTWMENSVLVPEYAVLSRAQCTYAQLSAKFPGYEEFILQQNHSSGGKGTFKMNAVNESKVYGELPGNEPLLVSPYYGDSVSANCHMVIGEKESILFPTSVQIIDVQNNKMIYSGGDFACGREVDSMMGDKLYKFKSDVAALLADAGYRGVCGVDYLVYHNEIYLIEINPRYQGSTFLLNHALQSAGYPHVSELTVAAFDGTDLIKEWKERIEGLPIDLEGHVVTLSDKSTVEEAKALLSEIEPGNTVFLDGFLDAKDFQDHPYLFKYFNSKSA